MNLAKSISFAAFTIVGLGAVGLVASFARADDKPYAPGAPASAVASPSASATALPSSAIAPPEPSGRGAWQPDFSGSPLPSEASKAPSADEWKDAPLAPEARVSEPGCTVKRLREWYRVTCAYGQIERVSGDMKDAQVECRREPVDGAFCEEGYLVFPARRGDARMFEVFVSARWGPEANSIISEQYLDGDKLPLVSIQGIRWGF